MIKKMGLAWISVADIKKTKQFFTEVLGLEVSSSAEEYGWLELKAQGDSFLLGAGQMQEGQAGPDAVHPSNNAIVTMSVDDLVQVKKILEDKHVTMLGDILEVPGHVKMQLFADPDGNKFQLVQSLDE